MNKKTKKLILCALKRAIRTFFQTFIATIGTASILTDVNWKLVLSASTLSAILSIATSVVTGLPESEVK